MLKSIDNYITQQKEELPTWQDQALYAVKLGALSSLMKSAFYLGATRGSQLKPSIFASEYYLTPLVIAPLFEEMVFRYALQGKVMGYLGLQSQTVRILLSNALFAGYHLKVFPALPAFLVFLMSSNALVFEVTGSVKMSILSHATQNLVNTLFATLRSSLA